MAASNADQPPPVDEAGEHAFFLEDESGSMQISVDSSHFHLDAGTAPTHPGWGPFRRTSNGSDSGWSNASDFTGITASTLDESPFTDDDDSLILPIRREVPPSFPNPNSFFMGTRTSQSLILTETTILSYSRFPRQALHCFPIPSLLSFRLPERRKRTDAHRTFELLLSRFANPSALWCSLQTRSRSSSF
ncbi:hypothetical protein BDZ89DRAFT_402221 [Hymenopellis radicata]|nr:hypothetical protein BDZ89DRAFT_402221 [Hymenopellis radicata]